MKKKYVPAELEIVMAEICDVITSSMILPEPEGPEIPTPDVDGGGHNQDGWIGI